MFVRANGGDIALGTDRFVLIPPETSFASRMERSTLHLYVHFLTSVPWNEKRILTLPTTGGQRETLAKWVAGDPKHAHRWTIPALVACCLDELPGAYWRNEWALSERIRKSVEMLEARFPTGVKVTELARHVGMNSNAFIRAFKQQTGYTPAHYQMERRIAMACLHLHHSNFSIEKIAADCGFCDRYYFTRMFCKCRGIAPGSFRRQMGKSTTEDE